MNMSIKQIWNNCKKELHNTLFQASGYVIIALFLIATSLFLWLIPGTYNVFETGYAQLDGLFFLAPLLFLFLVPALCMRLYAEERAQGTLETLVTRPFSKTSIVLGKALATFILVILALLPTLFWLISMNWLADPVGNIDYAAFWGSFIGLLFLALSYISIGSWASSISNNQLVAFIIGAVVCFLCYYGFDLVSSLFQNGNTQYWIQYIGINAHYHSLSRGVIDSRDILYFLLLSSLFFALTKRAISQKD